MPRLLLPRRSAAFAVLLASVPLFAAEEPIDQVGKLASDWIRTRAETARVEGDWAGQRELLATTIKAVEERAKMAEEQALALKAVTAQVRDEIATLAGRNQAAEKALASADERLAGLVTGLTALRPSLPPRLQAALELPYRSLEAANLPAGERMQHAMTILGRCVQFNRVITSGEEVLAIAGETAPKSLEVIYWGLSHGYALDRPANKAWLGSSAGQGWTWEPLPDAAPQVAQLLAVAHDQADPEFVVLPARLDETVR